MKRILYAAMLTLTTLLFTNTSGAQVRVGVNINIGDQPEWGPAGYDYAEYYYMPDIETYYYVPGRQFIYLSGDRWVFSAGLPSIYAGYDLYGGYKVVCNSHRAYNHFYEHRAKYACYRNHYHRQVIIVNRRDNGNHYGHYKNKWRGGGHGRGHGRGHGN